MSEWPGCVSNNEPDECIVFAPEGADLVVGEIDAASVPAEDLTQTGSEAKSDAE